LGYVGNSPALKYTSFAVQHFTTSATTGYTLDHAVNNENDIRLVINNVVQQPGSGKAYTATGTTLTLSAATTSSDTMYCVFLGKAVQTVNPGAGSVGTSQLATDAVTNVKVADDAIGVDELSATGTASSSTFLRGDNSWTDPGGVTLSGSTDNTVATVTGANALQGETNFIYNGTIVGAGADGANADLGVGVNIKTADSGASASAYADELVIENSDNSGISILSGTSGEGNIRFGDSGDNSIGRLLYKHNDNSMQFVTNGSERLRILSTGGITFNAATAAADALDDYEEGTFTPTMVPTTAGTTTYTTQAGYYVKIGKFVQITGAVGWSAQTGSGQPRVGGLPFAISSEDSNYGTNGLGMTDLTLTSTDYQAALVPQPSGSYANIHECKSGSRGSAPHDSSAFITIGMTYGTLS